MEVQAAQVAFYGFIVGVVGDGGLEPGGEAGDCFFFAVGLADRGGAEFVGGLGLGMGGANEVVEGGAGVEFI